MIIKEDDAYAQWCPLQGTGKPLTLTGGALPADAPRCCASLCMAWLWVNKDQETGCCGFAHTRKGGEAD